MGNSMHLAKRITHGADLEFALACEIATLAHRYPRGFVVRLHVLGDFYSHGYVRRWRRWMEAYPALHVFGYTAHDEASKMGRALRGLRAAFWPRFMLRFSTTIPGHMRAITLAGRTPAPLHAIECPAELGKARSCGACALCWSEAAQGRTIAFRLHGATSGRPKKEASV